MYGVPRDSSVMCAPWRPRWLRQGSAVRCPRLSAGRPIRARAVYAHRYGRGNAARLARAYPDVQRGHDG
jgi:hypothetical protein